MIKLKYHSPGSNLLYGDPLLWPPYVGQSALQDIIVYVLICHEFFHQTLLDNLHVLLDIVKFNDQIFSLLSFQAHILQHGVHDRNENGE